MWGRRSYSLKQASPSPCRPPFQSQRSAGTRPLLPGHLGIVPCPVFSAEAHCLAWLWEAAKRTETAGAGRPVCPTPAWPHASGVNPGKSRPLFGTRCIPL